MVEVFGRRLAGQCQQPADLLRREQARTPRAWPVGQQRSHRFPQALGLVLQLFQVRTAFQPTPPPQPHGLFAQPPLLGDGLVRPSCAGGQHDARPLH